MGADSSSSSKSWFEAYNRLWRQRRSARIFRFRDSGCWTEELLPGCPSSWVPIQRPSGRHGHSPPSHSPDGPRSLRSRTPLPLPGFRPFVEACSEADEKGEALKYIPKLADPRDRAESLMHGLVWQKKLLMLPLRLKLVNCWDDYD